MSEAQWLKVTEDETQDETYQPTAALEAELYKKATVRS